MNRIERRTLINECLRDADPLGIAGPDNPYSDTEYVNEAAALEGSLHGLVEINASAVEMNLRAVVAESLEIKEEDFDSSWIDVAHRIAKRLNTECSAPRRPHHSH